MERREAVKYISLLLGGTIIGGSAILSGCKTKTGVTLDFTTDQVAWLNEVANTILPDTKTPGAKAAKVGEFMKVMVNDCYEKKDQDICIVPNNVKPKRETRILSKKALKNWMIFPKKHLINHF